MNRFRLVYDTILNARYVSTQEEFSQMTKISRTIVSQLLNGHRKLNVKHIDKICAAYPFVNTDWLREGTGDMLKYDLPNEPTEEEILDSEAYLNEQLRQYEEGQADLQNLMHKASLYDEKVKEVQSLYAQLSDTMKKLQEKESEISTLNGTISSMSKTNQLLKTQLTGLRMKERDTSNQSESSTN